MEGCWNGFCLRPNCDGVHHTDAAGVEWSQERWSQRGLCAWFLMCTEPATGVRDHPVLGEVEVCGKHAMSP